MGGGGQNMGVPLNGPTDSESCTRSDGKNLATFWEKNNPKGKFVTTSAELMSLDLTKTESILGLFSQSHMPYHALRTSETPTLANMTMQAIRLLKKNNNGFLLMVTIAVEHIYTFFYLIDPIFWRSYLSNCQDFFSANDRPSIESAKPYVTIKSKRNVIYGRVSFDGAQSGKAGKIYRFLFVVFYFICFLFIFYFFLFRSLRVTRLNFFFPRTTSEESR